MSDVGQGREWASSRVPSVDRELEYALQFRPRPALTVQHRVGVVDSSRRENTVTNEEIWAMLRRGGLSVEMSAPVAGERPEPALVGRYHGMLDPAGVAELGVLLAEKARTFKPNVVVVGEGANDLILGFVVAKELELPLVRVLNLEGLVGASGTLPARPRAVFVADRVHKREFATAVSNLIEREGGELAAIVALVDLDVPRLEIERIGLVTVAEGVTGAD
jgi:hypothetical protein